jgi:hypothetical protein
MNSNPSDTVQYAWIEGKSEVITLPDGSNTKTIPLPMLNSNKTITFMILTNLKTLHLGLGEGISMEISDTMLDSELELDITKVTQTEELALQKWNEIVTENLMEGVKIQFLFTG